MHPHENKLKVYLYSGLSLSVILAALYILCFALSFDRTVCYFNSSLLVSCMHAVLILSIAWTASLLILMPREGLVQQPPKRRNFSTVMAYLLTLTFLVSALLHTKLVASSVISLIGSVLGGVGAAYFGITAIYRDSKREAASLLGYGVIAWTFFSIIDAYFNTYITMNSPMKLLLIFSMVFIMLFQLQEEAYIVGRGKPRLFVVFGLLNVMISLAFGASYIFCTVTKIYEIPEFLPSAIVSLAHAVYTVSRLLDLKTMEAAGADEPGSIDAESAPEAPDAETESETETGETDTQEKQ